MRPALLFAFVLVAACGTPEFQAERQDCAAIWLDRIPPVYRQRVVTHHRHVEYPTGRRICTGKGKNRVCHPEMTTMVIPDTRVETFDSHEARRQRHIAACTAAACVQKYGNAECRPAA